MQKSTKVSSLIKPTTSFAQNLLSTLSVARVGNLLSPGSSRVSAFGGLSWMSFALDLKNATRGHAQGGGRSGAALSQKPRTQRL